MSFTSEGWATGYFKVFDTLNSPEVLTYVYHISISYFKHSYTKLTQTNSPLQNNFSALIFSGLSRSIPFSAPYIFVVREK